MTTKQDILAIVVLISIIAGVIAIAVVGTTHTIRNKDLCQQQGGLYFVTRSGDICLAKSAVIDLDTQKKENEK